MFLSSNTASVACLDKLLCLFGIHASLCHTCGCHAIVMVEWTHHILTTVFTRRRLRVKGDQPTPKAKWIMSEISLGNGQVLGVWIEPKIPLHNDGHIYVLSGEYVSLIYDLVRPAIMLIGETSYLGSDCIIYLGKIFLPLQGLWNGQIFVTLTQGVNWKRKDQ